MKKIQFLIILLVSLSITSCGFKPILLKKDINFYISDIKITGDKKISSKISERIKLFSSKKESKNKTKIIINAEKEEKVISKDSGGNALKYLLTVNVNIKIYTNDTILKEKNFSENFIYNNSNNKFELRKYKMQIENNLIDKIIEEIDIFFYSI